MRAAPNCSDRGDAGRCSPDPIRVMTAASKRRVSTVVVQRFCKPKVGGSNPSPGTRYRDNTRETLGPPENKGLPDPLGGTKGWYNGSGNAEAVHSSEVRGLLLPKGGPCPVARRHRARRIPDQSRDQRPRRGEAKVSGQGRRGGRDACPSGRRAGGPHATADSRPGWPLVSPGACGPVILAQGEPAPDPHTARGRRLQP